MNKLLFLLALAILGIAAFLARSGFRPAFRINHWQAGMLGDGQYFPMLTVFILALPFLLVLALIKWWWQRKKSGSS